MRQVEDGGRQGTNIRAGHIVGRMLGAFVALIGAGYSGLIVAVGVWAASLATQWDDLPPRDHPTWSGGVPVPPWGLVDWLVASAVEITAFGILAACLVVVVALLDLSRRRLEARDRWRRAGRFGFRMWVIGVPAMSVYAAAIHISNWISWNAFIESDIHLPYFPDSLEGPGGAIVMVAVGVALVYGARRMRWWFRSRASR